MPLALFVSRNTNEVIKQSTIDIAVAVVADVESVPDHIKMIAIQPYRTRNKTC